METYYTKKLVFFFSLLRSLLKRKNVFELHRISIEEMEEKQRRSQIEPEIFEEHTLSEHICFCEEEIYLIQIFIRELFFLKTTRKFHVCVGYTRK